ncbi:ATP-binding protein [Pseudoalteromonas sp. ACER1]|jgi:signal transduction histidine kinase|uniref:histidine kinase n=1 Tax=Pseudoalteromonas lipolytica TaxID=570156 RepID=A0A0P7DVZ1_9GAMM|nr:MULTISPECIES: HAMP domain-containing sensor histidine kinase [Pseudoalteromonas]MAH28546.1 ATP-binding protein [Pseudoalteromonadaceae bacterium]MED5513592.1 ATP-binding protein [Pseudomonadota bacterium]KPM83671.1 histidine kinase [Pseudoalteromonas lipolytica]MCF2847935.1 ATP-binding protein [Pseudoalteromonas sp. PAST1]MCF2915891.1 ATP-binding protein [Pseudoalteromonas sp. Cn5-37]|tara:strand:- start:98 stop:1861 length:1764 start_codon:yes stop_codon:yes gene_type:complete
MLQKSLSKELLTNVLSVYFLLTFVVTCGQVIAEYVNTKDYIRDELTTLQKTFSRSLTRAIWELNDKQTITTAEGLLAIPMIEGIIVRDDSGEVLSQLGRSLDIHELYSQQLVQEEAIIEDTPSGLFGYTFPLIFEFSGKTTQVGDVTLFSSREVVFSRIMISIYFLIGNAMIKTTFLIILFLLAFRKRLTEPLAQFTEQIEDLELNDLEGRHIEIHTTEHNELKVMEESFNRLIDKVVLYREELEHTQKELVLSNEKLDQHNLQLEQEVARKTSNLSQAMMDLQQQKYELEKQKLTLTEEIDLRKQTEQELITKQTELQRYVDELNLAQERLVGSEKMAALGGLVAGITHDVNTPIGIGVTATSFLQERLDQIEAAYKEKTLSPKALEEFINDAKQSTSLLTSNLDRASELVASFKQIAVDQASEAVRTINFKEYLGEVIRSLHPKLKKTSHHINLDCPEDLTLNLPAGAISQIFTNLIMNALIHGFEGIESGIIDIIIKDEEDEVVIDFKDNGNGVSEHQLEKLFDPFFTTKRDQGGSGLGTHITLNLVKQTLGGDIEVTSEVGKGLHYHISFPKNMPKPLSMFNS